MEPYSALTKIVVSDEWIFSDHYTVCSRRDSNSRKVACMHTRQEWEEQEFDVCEGTTHVTLSHTVLVSTQCNELVNTFQDRAVHTMIWPAAHQIADLWLKMFF